MQNHNLIIIIAISMALSACSQKTLKTQCGVGPRECGDGMDYDGDGYCDDVDCNENDCDVHPDADETCDGFDDDCDGIADNNIKKGTDGSHEYYIDRDFDGFAGSETAVVCDMDVTGYCNIDQYYFEDKHGKFCVEWTVDGCAENSEMCALDYDCCDQDGDDGCVDGFDPACVYPVGGECQADYDACPNGKLH